MSNMIPFEFEGNNIRVITGEDGEPWFIASDVSEALGYSQTNAMNKIIDKEDKTKHTLQIGGNYVNQSLINESGVYQAIFGSTKPEAKRFKKWVTGEVLPSIRKTGSYELPMSREEQIARALIASQEIIEEKNLLIAEQTKKIQEDAPKVDYYEQVGDAEGLMTMGEAIKQMNLGVGRNEAYATLRSMKILQSNQTDWNLPYQHYINQGYFKVKQKILPNNKRVSVTLITPKGHQWLFKKLT